MMKITGKTRVYTKASLQMGRTFKTRSCLNGAQSYVYYTTIWPLVACVRLRIGGCRQTTCRESQSRFV